MKYAIVGEKHFIRSVSDTEPSSDLLPKSATIVEFNDEQVSRWEALNERAFYLNGKIVSSIQVPSIVTPRQLRLALIAEGVMPQEIDEALNAIEDPTERAIALTEWEYSLSIRRGHPLIGVLATIFDKSDDEVDDIFRKAGENS